MIATKIQKTIMRAVIDAHDLGHYYDVNELYDHLGMTASIQALQCSLKFLEIKDFVSRTYLTRRGAKRRIVQPTALALSLKSYFY